MVGDEIPGNWERQDVLGSRLLGYPMGNSRVGLPSGKTCTLLAGGTISVIGIHLHSFPVISGAACRP